MKMDANFLHSNGSETKIIDTLRGIMTKTNSTEVSKYCRDPLVADFIYTLGEIKWRCPDLLGSSSSHSNSNDGGGSTLSWQTHEAKLFLTIIFLFVGIVGFLGNLMTVVVIYRSLHSKTNYFLASLAISDLLLIIVGVPFDLVSLWTGSIAPAIPGYCETTSTAISWFTFVSILIIVALTAERLVAICYPFSLRSLFTNGRIIHLIIATWGFAFFPSLYIGLQFKQVTSDLCGKVHLVEVGHGSCDFVGWMDFAYTFEVMLFLTFVLPIIFIIYSYFRILKTLNEMQHNRTVRIELENLNNSKHITADTKLRLSGRQMSQKAQKVVTKMLITVAVVFFICYLPYHVERLIVWYSGESCQQ
uniref:G-protein coupled receptors family 1 profile domain-containing protein n=1 Tax=Panagrolaimus sp. JU765 TaxID=591449 RepID=A0AC34QFF6_9BILA